MKRNILISDLKVGYILEEDVKTKDNKILIKKGSVLTENLIFRLKQWSAKEDCMLIVDDGSENLKNKDELQEKVSSSLENVFNASPENLSSAISDLTSYLSHIYDDLKTIEDIPEDAIKIRYAQSNGGHYFRMATMACALASLYNRELAENDQQKISLQSVALASLLHDYGKRFRNDLSSLSKLKIEKSDYESDKMLNVPYRDTHHSIYSNLKLRDMINGPYDEKYHNAYAYVALKDKVPEDVRAIIYYSNLTKESFQNRKYNTIVQAANIIAICDFYDSLLESVIKEDMSIPFENVISYMNQLVHNNVLDVRLFKLFLSHIPIYPVGLKVLLSNDQYAVVVKKSSSFPTKPVVLTLPPSNPQLLDLSEITNITIRRIVKEEENASLKVDSIQREQLNCLVEFEQTEDVAPDGVVPATLILKKGETAESPILGKRFPGFSNNKIK